VHTIAWQSVKNDPFFAGVNWSLLAAKKLTPPILPEDPGPDQCNNFDEDFTAQVRIL
jgi:serine/threonine protein kinase SCH9